MIAMIDGSKSPQSLWVRVASALMRICNTAQGCPKSSVDIVCRSFGKKTHLSVQDIDGLEPLLLRHPVLHHLPMIPVEIRIEQIEIGPPVSLNELVHHLGFKVILRQSASNVPLMMGQVAARLT